MLLRRPRVSYHDFWPGFDPKSFFDPLMDQVVAQSELRGIKLVDSVSISSVFPRHTLISSLRRRVFGHSPTITDQTYLDAEKRIWFTGENQRPPRSAYDLTLSFDTDDYQGTNLYVPFALLALDWFQLGMDSFNAPRLGRSVSPGEVAAARDTNICERPKFACAFISNPEPTRMRAIDLLNQYKTVDVFGRAGQIFDGGKVDIASNYRFMVCFENDLYPGYVTEKVVDSWAAGCLPLWRGDDAAGILNKGAFINAKDFTSLSAFVDFVIATDNDPDAMQTIASQPLFSAMPSLQPLVEALLRTLALQD